MIYIAIYVTNSEGKRFKVTGSGGSGGIDEVPIATEVEVGGIKSSSGDGEISVDPSTGVATINDNVTMKDSGKIVLEGVGNDSGVHIIEFNDEGATADSVGYDNSSSGLKAVNMQSAIDEVNSSVKENSVSFNYIQNLLKYYSKENILDNWDLSSPLNQFNQGSYVNTIENQVSFDRWVTHGKVTVAYVPSTHVHVTFPNADYSTFGQYIPYPFRYAGKQITISCYCRQTSGVTSLVVTNNINQLLNIHLPTEWSCISYTITMPEANNVFYIGFQTQNVASEFDVMYVKAEVNNQQTLMHQENGVWILNDTPPNDGEKLIRCARYLQVFGKYSGYHDFASYFKYIISDQLFTISLQIPLITKMATHPLVSVNNGFRCLGVNTDGGITAVEIVPSDISNPTQYVEGFTNICNVGVLIHRTDKTTSIPQYGQVDNGGYENNYIILSCPVE